MKAAAKDKTRKPQDPLGIVEAALRLNERVHQDLESALELLHDERQRAAMAAAEREKRGEADQALISPAVAARLLGCDVRTLRRWTRAGRLPVPLQIGRVVRWRRAEIEALIP